MSDEQKAKIGLANKGRAPWSKGLKLGPMSEERKRKIAEATRRAMNEPDVIEKCSTAQKKRFANPIERQKTRLQAIKQLKENGGFMPGVDKGSAECFQWLNMFYDLHIQYPNYEVNDLGYFVDGYDKTTHSIYEYDTAYHLKAKYVKRDLERQREIIEHYKCVGKPLNAFYRINATGVGCLEIKNILNKTNER